MKKSEKLKKVQAFISSLGLTPEEVAAFLGEISVQVQRAKTANVACPGMYYYSDGTISADVIPGKQLSGVVGWVDDSGHHGMVLGLQETELSWSNSSRWCCRYAFDGIRAGMAFLPSKHELVKIFKNLDAIQKALEKIYQPRLKENDWYWSSSAYLDCSTWVVRPSNGNINNYDRSYSYRARCIWVF